MDNKTTMGWRLLDWFIGPELNLKTNPLVDFLFSKSPALFESKNPITMVQSFF